LLDVLTSLTFRIASSSKADEAIALIRWPPDKEGKVLYKKILLFVEMVRSLLKSPSLAERS
jgi:hypothetical protein